MHRALLVVALVAGVAAALFVTARRLHAPVAPVESPSGPSALDELVHRLGTGAITVVDLTQPLSERTPIIQLPPPLANTEGFERHLISAFDEKGPAWYWNWLTLGEHAGTHFDAPCHWITGRDRACVDALDARQFIGPAAVIDATAEAAGNADFVATRETIQAWEETHGRIPAGAWVILRTGWGSRAHDAQQFMNVGADGAPHYPGFGKDSAEFLTTQRDVLGVGTEAVGTDAAAGATAAPPFPNHSIMHGAGKFGLTQLANVDRLPPAGAVIIAAPLKIERGSGSPVRVIALVEARD